MIYSVTLKNGIEFSGVLISEDKNYYYFISVDLLGRLEEYFLVKKKFILKYTKLESILNEFYKLNIKLGTFNSYNIDFIEVKDDFLEDIISYCTANSSIISYSYENEIESMGIISGFLSNNLNIQKIDSETVKFIGSVRVIADKLNYIRFNGPKYFLLRKSYERKIQLS